MSCQNVRNILYFIIKNAFPFVLPWWVNEKIERNMKETVQGKYKESTLSEKLDQEIERQEHLEEKHRRLMTPVGAFITIMLALFTTVGKDYFASGYLKALFLASLVYFALALRSSLSSYSSTKIHGYGLKFEESCSDNKLEESILNQLTSNLILSNETHIARICIRNGFFFSLWPSSIF